MPPGTIVGGPTPGVPRESPANPGVTAVEDED